MSFACDIDETTPRHPVQCALVYNAAVTQCDLHYEGSITIDPNIMSAANILKNEVVHVTCSNGNRFITYAIEGEEGSGTIGINGAAARLACQGDTVNISTISHMSDEKSKTFKPTIVFLENENQKISCEQETANEHIHYTRQMLNGKLHQITVTDCDSGQPRDSIIIDGSFMEEANFIEGGEVHVLNIANGERFTTFAHTGQNGSLDVSVTGPGARLVEEGDQIIILSYSIMPPGQAQEHEPKVLIFNQNNTMKPQHT